MIIILVPAFILTVLWVLFNVYHNYISSTITDPLTHQIIPIEGSFDSDTIEEIKQRKRVEPANEIVIEVSETPTPTPQLEDEGATLSAEIDLENEEEEILEEE